MTSLPDGADFEPNEGPGPAVVGFDFDGTLAEQLGGWSLLYRLFGVEDAGEARTEAFWSGELTYDEWIAGNVADFRERGVRREHVERAAAAVKLKPGAEALLADLRDAGIPFGVVSAGLVDLIRPVEAFDPAFVVSNEIVYDDEGVPVDAVPRVPPESKGPILSHLCARAGADPADAVYVGDSAAEDGAFEVAGTAVLFDPTERIDDHDGDLIDRRVVDHDLTALREILLPDEA
ncbi:HAD-IB family phosphatase [Halosimplex marinum]|uniref:HAD-IB family phosphatase n=1 Tax=Halosimplex marinum TaxID=3396620 RepID=UPI003F54AB46